MTCASYELISQTRAGWLACFIATFVVSVALLIDARITESLVKISKKMIFVTVLSISISAVSLGIFYPTLFQPLSDISQNGFRHEIHKFTDDGSKTVLYDDTLDFRLGIWKNSLEMVKDRPITGFGLGNYKVFYPSYHQRIIKDKIFGIEEQLHHAHNDFIQIAVERGAVGLLLFIALIVSYFVMVYRLRSPDISSKTRLIIIGLSGGMIGFLVHAMFSFPMEGGVTLLLLFSYIAIISACFDRHISQKKHMTLKIPMYISVTFIAIVIVAGLSLFKFNINNIVSEKYYHLALINEKQKAWPEVINTGLKSYEYNHHQMGALFCVGRAYSENNEPLKGINPFKKALALYPYSINTMVNLAIAYQKTNNEEEALETLQQVLAIKPDYSEVLANIGDIYMKKNDYENALTYFERAVEYDEGNHLLHISLGFLNYKRGRYLKAAERYERVLELKPDMALAHKGLGIIYYKYLKQAETAFYHMRKYIELQPDAPVSNIFKSIISDADIDR
ncbi:MAG: tetratricopeptide repeat protein [Desulfobacterales bacterium]|nr:tetratricopeptide repeat protein [Desulfobacterales bacterium]